MPTGQPGTFLLKVGFFVFPRPAAVASKKIAIIVCPPVSTVGSRLSTDACGPLHGGDAEITQGSPGQFRSGHPTTLTPHEQSYIHSLCAVCERAVQVGRACTKPEQTRRVERAFRSLVGKSCSHPRCWMGSHGHWAVTSARGLS